MVIEDSDGDGAIRIPDEVLKELGVDVGNSLYLIEEYVGTTRCLVLRKSPQILDRIDEPVNTWDGSTQNQPAKQSGFVISYQLS